MEQSLIIRKATESDIKDIATIKVNGWKSAYTDIIDSNYLNSMSINDEIKKYNNKKYSLDTVFIAEQNNEILGFCRVYDYKESPYDDKEIDCEIREIYVKPDMKRKGIGSKLFTYVLNYFIEKNKNKLYLGVFENNYKSRNFYEKMGGVIGKKANIEINGKYYNTVSYIYKLNK